MRNNFAVIPPPGTCVKAQPLFCINHHSQRFPVVIFFLRCWSEHVRSMADNYIVKDTPTFHSNGLHFLLGTLQCTDRCENISVFLTLPPVLPLPFMNNVFRTANTLHTSATPRTVCNNVFLAASSLRRESLQKRETVYNAQNGLADVYKKNTSFNAVPRVGL